MTSRTRRSEQRGFTLAELLTVLVIIGLFFSISISILNPLTRAATQGQAKLETVQTAAQGFYVIQRDLRMARPGSTFVCDTGGTTCTTSGQPVIAIPTALDANGNISLSTASSGSTVGRPNWKGFIVYWTSGGKLYRSYQAVSGVAQPPTSSNAQTAVQQANPSSPAVADTFLVGDYQLSVSVSGNVTTLQMIAQSTYGGSKNQTAYNSNVVPQNNY